MRDRKKPEEPQEEGSPAWMNTYGDMVTLVLTFFVLLFSFSTIDAAKWEEIVNSLAGLKVVAISELDPNAPENTGDNSDGKFIITSPTPVPEETPTATPGATPETSLTNVEIKERFDELYERIKNHIESNDLGYILSVEYTDENTILLRMSDRAFFASGSASIKKDAKASLSEVCDIIMEYADLIKMIQIEGHTDNVPIHNGKYDDNWDLSYARAKTVWQFVAGQTDFNPSQLALTAYGEHHPVASNDTEEGKAKNRRVDFVIESILKVS